MDPQDTEGSKMTFLIPIKKDQKPFKCGLCSFSFDIILQLDDHVSEHSLTKPFQCGFCQVSYATSSELTLHVDTHQLFMCVAKGATTETLLQANGETGNFKAKDNCLDNIRKPTSRSTSDGETSSATRTHFNLSKQQPKGTVTDSSSVKRVGFQCIPCRLCGQMFKRHKDLKKHSITDHADDRPYHCIACPLRFKQNIHLKNHMFSVHGSNKPHVCPFCSERFKIWKYLRNHIAKKHPHNLVSFLKNKRKLREEAAKRTLTVSTPLKAAGTESIPCRLCGKMFKYQKDLKKHSVTDHADDRPFHCTKCPSRFKQNNHFRDHVYSVHGLDTPHACPFCSESFKIRKYLRKHITKKHPHNLVSFLKHKRRVRKEGVTDKAGENGCVSKGVVVSELQLSDENAETVTVTADREGGDISDEDRTTSDHVGYCRKQEGEKDSEDKGGNQEDYKMPPCTLLTSSFSTDSTPPVFAAPQTPALWNLSQDQLEMKVEVDFDSSDSTAQDTNVCMPEFTSTGLALCAAFSAPTHSKHE